MSFSVPSLALAVLALGCFLALELAGGRLAARTRLVALAGLVGAAFVFHIGLLRWDAEEGLDLRLPPAHLHEVFHYFLGTKYFAEVGHAGLYEAAIVADLEDDAENFRPEAPVRNLATNQLGPRGDVVPRADAVKAPFSPERWEAFKADLALIRDTTQTGYWYRKGYYVDHGYNGTPLVTAILGGLASQESVGTWSYLGFMRVLDPYLVLLVGVVVAAIEGAAAGLLLLFFVFANPMNEYGFVGGGYLRYNYLIALALALLAWRMRRLATCGALFAVAGGLRLFPLAFPAILLARDLLAADRGRRVRANGRLYAGFAGTLLAIFVATSFVDTPDGRNPWMLFADNIAAHAEKPSANRVGLAVPFGYAPSKDRHTRPDELAPLDWRRETRRVLAERRVFHVAAAGVLLALVLVALRREEGPAPYVLGLLAIFACLPLAHYYWAMLGLVPLAVGYDRRVTIALAACLLALAVTASPVVLRDSVDLRFALYSGAIGAFLLVAVGLQWRGARRGATAIAAVSVLALALAGCSGDEPDPEALPPLPANLPTPVGDRFESRLLGFSVEKPGPWSFREGRSSVRTELPERVLELKELWRSIENPGTTPVVEMRLHPEPYERFNPSVRIFDVPMRPGETVESIREIIDLGLPHVLTSVANTRAKYPGFEVLEPASPRKIAGFDGYTMLLFYRWWDKEKKQRFHVIERLSNLRRGQEYWTISEMGPAPEWPGDLRRDFDRIVASISIEPVGALDGIRATKAGLREEAPDAPES